MKRLALTALVILACIILFAAAAIITAITTTAGDVAGIGWLAVAAVAISLAGAFLREAADG